MDFRTMLKKKQYQKWGNDEDAPDWGELKKREEEEVVQLKKVERVRTANTGELSFFKGGDDHKQEEDNSNSSEEEMVDYKATAVVITKRAASSTPPACKQEEEDPKASLQRKRFSLGKAFPSSSSRVRPARIIPAEEGVDLKELLRKTSLNPVKPNFLSSSSAVILMGLSLSLMFSKRLH